MSVISIITAVHSGGSRYLRDAYESLVKQELPPGWDWRWCLQEDGDTGEPPATLPADPRISYGTGLPARAGVARTMALTRADGPLIRTLDADDILLPGALQRDITTLERVAWCTSACLDLLPDGTTEPGPYDPEDGPVERGRFYREHGRQRLSVQAVTFAAHTELVWAVGGWPALTGAETDGLLLAAEAVSNGWFIAEPSLLYRKHDAQTTASSRYWHNAESAARSAAVRRRADALRRAGWAWAPPDKQRADD
ncbi:glycosyltransferase [Amycolatopsis magusensis]|uniref:glycosyltransferase n=1 Tax=Amycolatopsis magusensis TaxID=882444 RepID=UPI0024A8AD58|nr:glycosyltransferase [Amycolatopsis magusensis]MDI5977845.1 glycosyltransferase [Amycolatopsis magusensis]